MIPAETGISEEGNLEGEIIEFEIDAESMRELMMFMVNLYPHPKFAVLRELATNALDSHKEAGQTRPIEIELPTDLAPTLIVRDFGVGMDIDEIRNVYTKFGASTRRDSNEYTGTLGMGSKSPFAYCPQFTVKSVKDGKMILATVGRQEDNTPAFKIMAHLDTTEPNGVEITIPRMERGDFAQEAWDLFQYWRPGEVLIDGQEPERTPGMELGDSIILQSHKRVHGQDINDYIVMGGVPYRVDAQHRLFTPETLEWDKTTRVIAYVKMGSVSFAPSREELIYTEQTKRTLDLLRKEIEGRIRYLATQDVSQAETHYEALFRYHNWQLEYGFKIPNLKYKGDEIPEAWDLGKGMHFTSERYGYSSRASYNTYNAHPMKWKDLLFYTKPSQMIMNNRGDMEIDPRDMPRIVIGAPFFDKKPQRYYNNYDLTQSGKYRLRIWSRLHNINRALILEKLPDDKWLSGLPVVDWSVVAACKEPRSSKPGSYMFQDVVTGKAVSVDTISPDGAGLYYVGNSPHSSAKLTRWLEKRWAAQGIKRDITVVLVPERRLAKFKKSKPKALPLMTIVKFELNLLDQTLKQINFERLVMSNHDVMLLKALGKHKVLDPEIRRLIRIAKSSTNQGDVDRVREYNEAMATAGLIADPAKRLGIEKRSVRDRLSDRYPLLDDSVSVYSYKDAGIFYRHLVDYLNWVYTRTISNGHLSPDEIANQLSLSEANEYEAEFHYHAPSPTQEVTTT
jgi:histidine kinase/DNA gyrase B/HSP90-like ATPase